MSSLLIQHHSSSSLRHLMPFLSLDRTQFRIGISGTFLDFLGHGIVPNSSQNQTLPFQLSLVMFWLGMIPV